MAQNDLHFRADSNKKMNKGNKLGAAIVIGIGIGTAVGVATDNLGLWIAVGVAIGAGVGTNFMQRGNKKDKDD